MTPPMIVHRSSRPLTTKEKVDQIIYSTESKDLSKIEFATFVGIECYEAGYEEKVGNNIGTLIFSIAITFVLSFICFAAINDFLGKR